jgi:hypothetical protein
VQIGLGFELNILFLHADWQDDLLQLETLILQAPGPQPGGPSVTVTNPGNQTGSVGTPGDVQIQASDTDGGKLTYAATGLPLGLSINPSTGLISGTPTTSGTYSVIVTAKDASGPSDQTSFNWTVNPGRESIYWDWGAGLAGRTSTARRRTTTS